MMALVAAVCMISAFAPRVTEGQTLTITRKVTSMKAEKSVTQDSPPRKTNWRRGRAIIPTVGKQFGRLYVQSRAPDKVQASGSKRTRYQCLCDCGKTVVCTGTQIRSGKTRSCGCLRTEMIVARSLRHANSRMGSHSRAYVSWLSMKARTKHLHQDAGGYYIKKGIKVCKRWRNSFEAFLEDMGEPPPGTSIDRINGNGHYEPGNCRWATRAMQSANRSNAILVTKTHCVAHWCELLKINPQSIYRKIRQGISPEKALFP